MTNKEESNAKTSMITLKSYLTLTDIFVLVALFQHITIAIDPLELGIEC